MVLSTLTFVVLRTIDLVRFYVAGCCDFHFCSIMTRVLDCFSMLYFCFCELKFLINKYEASIWLQTIKIIKSKSKKHLNKSVDGIEPQTSKQPSLVLNHKANHTIFNIIINSNIILIFKINNSWSINSVINDLDANFI